MILIMIFVRICVGKIDSTMKDMWLETHVKPAFQPRLTEKLSEIFRMFWEEILEVNIWQPTGILKTRILIIDKLQLYYQMLLLPAFSKILSDNSSPKSGIT